MPDFQDIIDRQAAIASDGSQFDALLSVFHRVCGNLHLEVQDAPMARTIARALIEAALAGELDPDGLYECAVQAVLAS